MQTSAVDDYHLAENLEIDCLSEARWWVDMNARAGDEAIFAQVIRIGFRSSKYLEAHDVVLKHTCNHVSNSVLSGSVDGTHSRECREVQHQTRNGIDTDVQRI